VATSGDISWPKTGTSSWPRTASTYRAYIARINLWRTPSSGHRRFYSPEMRKGRKGSSWSRMKFPERWGNDPYLRPRKHQGGEDEERHHEAWYWPFGPNRDEARQRRGRHLSPSLHYRQCPRCRRLSDVLRTGKSIFTGYCRRPSNRKIADFPRKRERMTILHLWTAQSARYRLTFDGSADLDFQRATTRPVNYGP
jgi:hypothetical protein